MHIVNYNAGRYASIQDALAGQDSLAVLGTFFEVWLAYIISALFILIIC